MKTLKNPMFCALPLGLHGRLDLLCVDHGSFFMEQWKPIKGYEGSYEISDQGRARSLARVVQARVDRVRITKDRILTPHLNGWGYLHVGLYNTFNQSTIRIHTLVWDAFGDKPRDGRRLQVDHINNVKTDNRIENLQLLSSRENVVKHHQTRKTSSKYTGVYWRKDCKKWMACMAINGKSSHLGTFEKETDAAQAYRDKLNEIKKNK